MIVQCRTCMTRYYLDDSVIGTKGCHVRCTSCGSIWHQILSSSKQAIVPYTPLPESSHKRRSWWWITTGIGITCLLALAFILPYHLPSSWREEFQQLLASSPSSSASLLSFSFQKNPQNEEITCQGTLYNSSSQVIKAPSLMLVFAHPLPSNSSHSLKNIPYLLSEVTLEPGKSHSFSITVTPPFYPFSFMTAFVS